MTKGQSAKCIWVGVGWVEGWICDYVDGLMGGFMGGWTTDKKRNEVLVFVGIPFV